MPSKWLSRAKNDRNYLVVLQQPPVLGQEHQASGGQEFKTALYTHTAYLITQPTGHRSTTDMHHIPQKPSYTDPVRNCSAIHVRFIEILYCTCTHRDSRRAYYAGDTLCFPALTAGLCTPSKGGRVISRRSRARPAALKMHSVRPTHSCACQ